MMAARGLVVTEEAKERVLTCSDLSRLDGWLRRATTATSVDELLED